jgi:dTDP-glucose 4,6-dehydratase
MKILVTGGAGFIGSCFVRMALKGEFENPISKITVLDALTYSGNLNNLNSVINSKKFKFVQGNITDKNLVDSLVKNHNYIINFAAESHVDRSINSSTEFVNSNFVGVQILMDSAKKYNVEKFIQISTDEVYGSISSGFPNELAVLEPSSPYAATKAAADLLVRSYIHTFNFPAIITRSSNNYGFFQNSEKLIPKIISNLANGKKIPIYGNGSNIRNWIHVKDHCLAISKILFDGREGEIYNISGDREISNLNLAILIIDIMGKEKESIEFVTDRKGHDLRYAIDSSKLDKLIGISKKINFENGLKETINWYLENPLWMVENRS